MVPRFGFQGVGTSGGAALAGGPDFWNVCALPGGLSSLASGSCLRTQENNRHVVPGLISCVKASGAPALLPDGCVLGWAPDLGATASGKPARTLPALGTRRQSDAWGIGVRGWESDLGLALVTLDREVVPCKAIVFPLAHLRARSRRGVGGETRSLPGTCRIWL